MSIADRSRQRTETELKRLELEYGEFDIYEEERQFTSTEYEHTLERFEADALGGAGAWVTNESGEVLLVKNKGHDEWSDPGGKCEHGETYAQAARREVYEETNVECELTGINGVTVIEIHDGEDPDRPPVLELVVVFDAEYRAGTPTAKPGGISAVRWWDELPENLLYDELADRSVPNSRP